MSAPDRPDRGNTPTPWVTFGRTVFVDTKPRQIIAVAAFGPENPEANAEFIAKACSAHDDLVAALNASHAFISEELERREHSFSDDSTYITEPKKLLAKIDSTLSLVGVVE